MTAARILELQSENERLRNDMRFMQDNLRAENEQLRADLAAALSGGVA